MKSEWNPYLLIKQFKFSQIMKSRLSKVILNYSLNKDFKHRYIDTEIKSQAIKYNINCFPYINITDHLIITINIQNKKITKNNNQKFPEFQGVQFSNI